jgi:lipoyl(octanoyl) transferase
MIQTLYLGRIAYDAALRVQEELGQARYEGSVGNVLLLLEHPPVLTLGRNADRTNVLVSDELLAARGITLHKISRGGDVTYHGPGQLVGYPIFDLRSLKNASGTRMGPVDFVRRMEDALMGVCGKWGFEAGRIAGLTGVWCGAPHSSVLVEGCGAPNMTTGRKIGAIGIHVSRGITSHGFAFNVTTDLRDFALINPCGITDKPVTSLELEMARAQKQGVPALEDVAREAARQFGVVLGETVVAVESLEALRAEMGTAREFPAEDTPMRAPREVERLRQEAQRPVRA